MSVFQAKPSPLIEYEAGVVNGYWEAKQEVGDCHPESVSPANFFASWERSFHNLKLRLEHSKEAPKNALNYKQWKYPEKYKTGVHVVSSGEPLDSYVAVIDYQNPQRAFVGKQVHLGYKRTTLIGGICYFDAEGNRSGDSTVYRKTLFKYDHLDGSPIWDTLFLCGNTLSFLWYHSVGEREMKLEGWYLRKDDLVCKYMELDAWYKTALDRQNREFNSVQVLEGRWLCCLDAKTRVNYCIDLMSFRGMATPHYIKAVFDSLTFPATLDPQRVIRSLVSNKVPAPEIDGYPLTCVKCDQPLARGKIKVAQHQHGKYADIEASSHVLGISVCEHCRIRFSLSEKKWICWDVTMHDGHPRECQCGVGPPNWTCTADHADRDTVWFRVRCWDGEEQDQIEACVCLRKSLQHLGSCGFHEN